MPSGRMWDIRFQNLKKYNKTKKDRLGRSCGFGGCGESFPLAATLLIFHGLVDEKVYLVLPGVVAANECG